MSVSLSVVDVKKAPKSPMSKHLATVERKNSLLIGEKPLTEPGSGRGGLLSRPSRAQMFTDNLVVYKCDFLGLDVETN